MTASVKWLNRSSVLHKPTSDGQNERLEIVTPLEFLHQLLHIGQYGLTLGHYITHYRPQCQLVTHFDPDRFAGPLPVS